MQSRAATLAILIDLNHEIKSLQISRQIPLSPLVSLNMASHFPMKKVIITLHIAFVSLVTGSAEEKEEPAYEPAKFFRTHILPILEKRCFECHSKKEETDDGGLILDTKSGWVEGGDHGPAVVPYDLKKSPLIRTIRSNGGNMMPPEEKLTPGEIALLSTWVLLGAPDPRPK